MRQHFFFIKITQIITVLFLLTQQKIYFLWSLYKQYIVLYRTELSIIISSISCCCLFLHITYVIHFFCRNISHPHNMFACVKKEPKPRALNIPGSMTTSIIVRSGHCPIKCLRHCGTSRCSIYLTTSFPPLRGKPWNQWRHCDI